MVNFINDNAYKGCSSSQEHSIIFTTLKSSMFFILSTCSQKPRPSTFLDFLLKQRKVCKITRWSNSKTTTFKISINGILWHFMPNAIWHKITKSMAIWVSKELNWSDKLICGLRNNFLGTKLDKKGKNIENQIFLCIFGKILCIFSMAF